MIWWKEYLRPLEVDSLILFGRIWLNGIRFDSMRFDSIQLNSSVEGFLPITSRIVSIRNMILRIHVYVYIYIYYQSRLDSTMGRSRGRGLIHSHCGERINSRWNCHCLAFSLVELDWVGIELGLDLDLDWIWIGWMGRKEVIWNNGQLSIAILFFPFIFYPSHFPSLAPCFLT